MFVASCQHIFFISSAAVTISSRPVIVRFRYSKVWRTCTYGMVALWHCVRTLTFEGGSVVVVGHVRVVVVVQMVGVIEVGMFRLDRFRHESVVQDDHVVLVVRCPFLCSNSRTLFDLVQCSINEVRWLFLIAHYVFSSSSFFYLKDFISWTSKANLELPSEQTPKVMLRPSRKLSRTMFYPLVSNMLTSRVVTWKAYLNIWQCTNLSNLRTHHKNPDLILFQSQKSTFSS